MPQTGQCIINSSLTQKSLNEQSVSLYDWVAIHQQLFTFSKPGSTHAHIVQRCIIWHRLVLIHHLNAEIFQKDIPTVYCIVVLRSACALTARLIGWGPLRTRGVRKWAADEYMCASRRAHSQREPLQCTLIPQRPAFSLVWRLSRLIPYKHGT